MLASVFVKHLEERGVTLKLRGDRFVARGASSLPQWTRAALATHRGDVHAFLEHGEDRDLKPSVARHELQRLGFSFIRELKQWVHVRGDAYGDAILLGLISPDEVEREQELAARELDGLHLRGVRHHG